LPYSQYSLNSLNTQLGILLDDQNALYWTTAEKTYAIQEALRVWGAYTSYWRTRGTFNLVAGTTFYDLSTQLPTLRTRTWTLNQLTQEIQFACLEAANGISGTGMSGQISIQSILQSIQRARNQVVIDARFPFSYNAVLASPSPDGLVAFPQTSVYVHRASWQDQLSGAWTNLWREDSWAVDHNNPAWTLETGSPVVYSESENAPLTMQLVPIPAAVGVLDALTVDSLLIDLTNPNAVFDFPDEWVHAIKYAALQDIFSSESQNKDALRAQYCEMRYQQSMDFAKRARSVIRLLVNGIPLPIDSLAALDAGSPYWRNQSGIPQLAGVLYDFLAVYPGVPDQAYGITADLVQSAPIPTAGTDPIPVGAEDIPHLIDYIAHILTFKCGGKEFQDSFAQYDSFLGAVAGRAGINRAKMRYLVPTLGQVNIEQQQRPDRMEEPASATK
jgi:hypothetical protein